jgi:putative hydrolase of the HAD superfamily
LPQIRHLFWDLGGVLLSNAWDRTQRERALRQFHLDPIEFDDRHDMVISSFERGKITLDDYLDRTVFYRPRDFSKQEFRDFMFSLSEGDTTALNFARALAKGCRYQMTTINNESRELNIYRIDHFGLRDIFSMFVSSCFVGLRKPEEGIYRMALEMSQRSGQECCFIDDRALNLEGAARVGMHVIRMQNTAQLQQDLEKLGVTA